MIAQIASAELGAIMLRQPEDDAGNEACAYCYSLRTGGGFVTVGYGKRWVTVGLELAWATARVNTIGCPITDHRRHSWPAPPLWWWSDATCSAGMMEWCGV